MKKKLYWNKCTNFKQQNALESLISDSKIGNFIQSSSRQEPSWSQNEVVCVPDDKKSQKTSIKQLKQALSSSYKFKQKLNTDKSKKFSQSSDMLGQKPDIKTERGLNFRKLLSLQIINRSSSFKSPVKVLSKSLKKQVPNRVIKVKDFSQIRQKLSELSTIRQNVWKQDQIQGKNKNMLYVKSRFSRYSRKQSLKKHNALLKAIIRNQ